MGTLRSLRRATKKRLHNRSRKQKPVTVEFKSFFEHVAGKPISVAEQKALEKQLADCAKVVTNQKASLSNLRKNWDLIAKSYSKVIEVERLEQEVKCIEKKAPINRADTIASIGSGPAFLEAFIAKKLAPQGKVTCIDLSPEMSKIALQTKTRAKAENMQILTRSGAETKLASASQDKVIIGQTNLTDTIHWNPVLKEARRIIKKGPGSKFILSFAPEKQSQINSVIKSLKKSSFLPEHAIKYASKGNIHAIMIIAKPI